VLAAGTGTVIFAGTVAGRGVVSVEHVAGNLRGGLRTTYEPVSPTVTTGQQVRVGEQIGIVQAAHPGCAVAACLHWGAYRGPDHDERSYLDPLRLLAWPRVRLLPVEPVPGRA
jgi:murein DD-endopeptidase MepM/ murein hydrolase activator NlpD